MTKERKEVTQCPHCGNTTPHKELNSVKVVDEVEFDGRSYDYTGWFDLWQCSTCDTPSLYVVTEDDFSGDPTEKYFNIANRVYPVEKKLDQVVPEKVRNDYLRARKVKKIDSGAFAVLIRGCLERICVEQNASGNSLKKKIDDLAKRDIIPKNLASMAETLRFLGNLGAHATDYEFGWQEVDAMDEFLVAVIEYVYVAPQKVQKLAETIQKKQNPQQNTINP